MVKMNPKKVGSKIQYEKSLLSLDIVFKFTDTKRYFQYTRPEHWDGTLEDLCGLVLSSYCGFPVYIFDQVDDFHLKSGISNEFQDSYYQIVICEDEWCSIVNEQDEIIYARFINFREYKNFEERVEKVVKDFFESEGFEIRG